MQFSAYIWIALVWVIYSKCKLLFNRSLGYFSALASGKPHFFTTTRIMDFVVAFAVVCSLSWSTFALLYGLVIVYFCYLKMVLAILIYKFSWNLLGHGLWICYPCDIIFIWIWSSKTMDVLAFLDSILGHHRVLSTWVLILLVWDALICRFCTTCC